MSVTEHDFSCTRDGLTIRGRAYVPEGEQLPAVVLSHGFGGNAGHMAEYGRAFASWGYAAFAFDFCGGSANGEGNSDGATTDMTIWTECADIQAVMDYVRSLPYVDAGRLSLMGASQGGFVSALAAAQRAGEVEALILLYPALCIPDHAREGALGGASYDVNEVPEVIVCGSMSIGRRFHETVVDIDPFEKIAPYQGPVLLMHGTDDPVVHYRYAVQAKESYAQGQCLLQLIQGAGHAFTEAQTAASILSIRQFLLGRKEALTINVQITGHEVRREEGADKEIAVFFTGTCEGPFFNGDILPGAEDVQQYRNDQQISLRADYTLEGTDCSGEKCRIHIVNQNVKGEWKPVVQTDSKALSFLNRGDLTAVLEGYADGLTVRIFSAVPQ